MLDVNPFEASRRDKECLYVAHQSPLILVHFYWDRKQDFCSISRRSFKISLELFLGFSFMGTGHTVWRKFVVSVLCTSKNIRALVFSFKSTFYVVQRGA